jgi:NAD(P)-dependent dehydrogenase (short-subunit alcohol dehydrogenase family)
MPELEQWFADQTAIVVGATGGLGSVICRELGARGAAVRMIGRREQALGEISAALTDIGVDATSRIVDIRDRDALTNAITAWDDASILVNAAGMNRPGPLDALSADDYDALMQTNVSAVYWASRAFVRARRSRNESGSIVNISSQMGHVGGAGRVAYCASKHAVEGLTKAMAVELAPEGWRVNSIAPTFVETELTEGFLAEPANREYVLSSIPQGRLASAEDVAAAVAFLASDMSASTTGTSVLIDGGWVAK